MTSSAQQLDETTPGFLIDLPSRLHAKTTPAMGFDGADVDRLIEIAKHFAEGAEAERASQTREAVTFEDAWAEKEEIGFHYGEDALENVRLGWDMARAAFNARGAGGQP